MSIDEDRYKVDFDFREPSSVDISSRKLDPQSMQIVVMLRMVKGYVSSTFNNLFIIKDCPRHEANKRGSLFVIKFTGHKTPDIRVSPPEQSRNRSYKLQVMMC